MASRKMKAKFLKHGQRFKIPAQTLVVRLKEELQGPTLDDKVYVLKVSGEKGPLKGQVWDMIVYGDEDVERVLKEAWGRRLYCALKKWVWG